MATTTDVLEHHLDTFGTQDLEGVMEDYDDESVIVTNMGTFRGLGEIEGLFEDLFAEFSMDGASIDMVQETTEGDFGYIVWEGETPENVYEFATDTFYIPEETIEFQTFAGKITPNE
ncbi:MAG: nuclear transport factor 2 family protein [Halodesulfurarchaeum sp.]